MPNGTMSKDQVKQIFKDIISDLLDKKIDSRKAVNILKSKLVDQNIEDCHDPLITHCYYAIKNLTGLKYQTHVNIKYFDECLKGLREFDYNDKVNYVNDFFYKRRPYEEKSLLPPFPGNKWNIPLKVMISFVDAMVLGQCFEDEYPELFDETRLYLTVPNVDVLHKIQDDVIAKEENKYSYTIDNELTEYGEYLETLYDRFTSAIDTFYNTESQIMKDYFSSDELDEFFYSVAEKQKKAGHKFTANELFSLAYTIFTLSERIRDFIKVINNLSEEQKQVLSDDDFKKIDRIKTDFKIHFE